MPDFMTEFERCSEWLQRAIDRDHGKHTLEDIKWQIATGRLQFWPGRRSVLITEFAEYPQKKYLHCFLAGGDLDEILDMEDSLEAFGRAHGCDGISLAGRRGWVKALPHWREVSTIVAREFNNTNSPSP